MKTKSLGSSLFFSSFPSHARSPTGHFIPAKDTMELMLSFEAELGSCESVCVGGDTLIFAGQLGTYLDVCGGCDSPCDYGSDLDIPSPTALPPPSASFSASCEGLCGGSADGCFCDDLCVSPLSHFYT